MHGDADARVGPAQGRRLHEGLVGAGARSTYVVVPGADHGTPEWSAPPVVAAVVDHLTSAWSTP